MRDFAIYTLARIGLFVAAYAVIAGVWMLLTSSDHVPILGPFLIAAVVSMVASFYLLAGPRTRFAAHVEQRASQASQRFEEARAREDQD